jgi:CPA2 family monovalent cation:H+ antiporter-2
VGEAHPFLPTFALVLCTAAITTVVFQRLKQPVILGYLLAGVMVGPYVTLVPVTADRGTTETLAELGVILLLFSIGLEFSIRRLLRVGPSVAVTALFDVTIMAFLGLTAAYLLGWTAREALYTGALVAISSTTIIAKTFEDHGVGRKLRDLVFGVLIVEDLAAVLFMAGLATLSAGGGTSGAGLLGTALRLFILLMVWVIGGLLVVPRLMRFIVRLKRPETTLVASLGICFAFALLAQYLGYSVALGAFIAGSLISESGKGHAVMELVRPVRDVFAAVFFVSVGMLIQPSLLMEYRWAILLLVAVVVVGKLVSVSLGAFLAGQGPQGAIQAGMSMAQIGEFSFIIASLGLATGAVGGFLYPVAVAVSAITTLLTPFMVRNAPAAAGYVDRKLPRALQTYAALYATWVEEMRRAPARRTAGDRVKGMIRWLLVDTACVIGVIVGMAIFGVRLEEEFIARLGLSTALARGGLYVTAIACCAPFLLGIFRMARGLAQLLANLALPRTTGFDRAAAPRRAMVASLEITIVFLLGLPVLLATQPFVSSFRGVIVLGVILLLMGVGAWRSATNLQGHVAAGAEVLIDALRSSLPPEQATMEMPTTGLTGLYPVDPAAVDRLTTATHMLPGIGAPTPFRMEPHYAAAGKTLAEVGLRGRTGATVLAISRGGVGIPAPSKIERLEAGDTLVLVGTKEALRDARRILIGSATQPTAG